MNYRVEQEDLMKTLALWDGLMPGRELVRLIACGGTALTLMGYKESTKDVDFLVPVEKEYQRFLKFLIQAGYQKVTHDGWKRTGENTIYDLYCGKKIYVTELLTSPLLKGGHKKIRQWEKFILGS